MDEAESNQTAAERDALAQALWDIYAVLGFDTDGDKTPGAVLAGVKGNYQRFAEVMVSAAQEHRDDYNETLSGLPDA